MFCVDAPQVEDLTRGFGSFTNAMEAERKVALTGEGSLAVRSSGTPGQVASCPIRLSSPHPKRSLHHRSPNDRLSSILNDALADLENFYKNMQDTLKLQW